ncbi:MAG TPA: pitrilysin family protein [Thermomicrobiaceae bacterium]|nr:pitrilysin family protein [Thermomicrobiaceae bacterium]
MNYQKTVLSNGLRVVSSRMEHVRSATLVIYVGVGSRYERADEAGISHFLEHMVFKGTEQRPDPALISQEIEGVGGILNASTGKESTNYWVKVPSAHLARSFDVLADMLRHSRFAPEEIDKERGVIVEEIRGVEDTPDELVHDAIDELIWPEDPLGRPISGWESTVAAIDRARLVRFLQDEYRPDRMVIAAAGDLRHEEVVALADQHFGDLRNSNLDTFRPVDGTQRAPRVQIMTKPTNEAHLCLGFPAVPYTDERRYAQEMLDAVLSSGMSSRLFVELRERLGLAYEVYAFFREYADTGQGVVYAGIDPARLDETVHAIVRELRKLREEPVPAEELRRTKELRKGRILVGLEDSRAVASWIGGQELVFGEVWTPEQLMDRIDAVSAEDMQVLARDLFQPERYNLVTIGPVEGEQRLLGLLRE